MASYFLEKDVLPLQEQPIQFLILIVWYKKNFSNNITQKNACYDHFFIKSNFSGYEL
jgi:hypothetical protein